MQAYHDVLEKLSKNYTYRCMYDIVFGNAERSAAQYFDKNEQLHTVTYSEYEQRIDRVASSLSEALKGGKVTR